ncbi:MAG TPA: hypothetical protein VM618_05065, partial [Acidimicrobiia bacterium]|nr:hypothetical protein [Acidimicrobiia bacterium]
MRVTLIVNTTASSVTPRARVVIQKALSADHDVEVVETARRGHASRIANGAARAVSTTSTSWSALSAFWMTTRARGVTDDAVVLTIS